MVDYIFSYNESSLYLYLWDVAYMVMVDNLFDMVLDFFQYFIEHFTFMFMREIVLQFFFFVESLCGLGIIVTSLKEFGKVLSSYFLRNNLRSIGTSFSLKVW